MALTLDVVKIRSAAEKIAPKKSVCWPQQLMYAICSNPDDDQQRRVVAASYCACKTAAGHESLTSAAHEPHAGITKALVMSHSTRS